MHAPGAPRRVVPVWTRVGLSAGEDGHTPLLVVGLDADDLTALRAEGYGIGPGATGGTGGTEATVFDDDAPAVAVEFRTYDGEVRLQVVLPLGELLGAANGWGREPDDDPDAGPLVPWLAVPADTPLPASGLVPAEWTRDPYADGRYADDLFPEAIVAAARSAVDPALLTQMEGILFAADELFPDAENYVPTRVPDMAALLASVDAFMSEDPETPADEAAPPGPLAALAQGLGGMAAGAEPGAQMFGAMEEQAIAERRDLWIAVAAAASGLPVDPARLDAVAAVGAMPLFGRMRFTTITVNLLVQAVGVLQALPDAVTSDAGLPPAARKLYRAGRHGGDRAARALDGYTEPRAALDDVVAVAGWAARTAAAHSGEDRIAAGVAAHLVADLLDNRDVWVDAISAAADTPPLAATLFAGLVQELHPDSPAVADLDRLAGELRRLRARLPEPPPVPDLTGVALAGVSAGRVHADASALLDEPQAQVSALATEAGWPQAAATIAAALVAVATGHAAAHGGAPGDVVRSLLARWRFLTDAV